MAQIQAVASFNVALASSLNVTIASSGSGNTLLAFAWLNSDVLNLPADTPDGVTDNQGQTWTQAFVPNATAKIGCWYKTGSVSGVTTVTFTWSAGAPQIVAVIERDDIASASPYDVSAFNSASSAGTWSSGATATTAQADSIAYALASSTDGTNRALAASGSWTPISGTGFTSGRCPNTDDGDDGFMADWVLSSTQTVTATGTCTNPSNVRSSAIVFKRVPATPTTVAWWRA
jgi:hypothetical protein